MTARRSHRILGLIMIAPLVCWALTGLIFLVKPGYSGAYDTLQVKAYPLPENIAIRGEASWTEVRYVRTILGDHVLAKSSKGWANLDMRTLQPSAPPEGEALKRLVADAIAGTERRYGAVETVADGVVRTTTGVRITLDWSQLRLSQHGRDTDPIDRLYKIHYLQWTGITYFDRILGVLGIGSLIALTVLGLKLFRG